MIYIAIVNFRLSNKITETQGLNHVCPSIIFIAKDNVLNWCVITRVHLHCDWSCWWFTVRGNCQLFSGCKNSSIYCQRSLLTLTCYLRGIRSSIMFTVTCWLGIKVESSRFDLPRWSTVSIGFSPWREDSGRMALTVSLLFNFYRCPR